MKRILALTLIPLFLFIFAGCATNKTEETDEETEVIQAEEQQAPLQQEVKNQTVQKEVESTETAPNCAYHGEKCPYDTPTDCPDHFSTYDSSHHGNGHHGGHE